MDPATDTSSPPISLDPSAWVDRHADILYRFALRRLRSPELAENAVQETFLAALAAQASFSGASSERSWLVGILKRKVVDHFRHIARESPQEDLDDRGADTAGDPTEELFDDRGHWRVAPARWGAHPGAELERSQFWRSLERCLHLLPRRQAQAFALLELDEIESAEACDVLEISAANLWVLMHRARSRLRRCLEQTWFDKPKEAA